ncbi:MAG TPA: hypothetical protein VER58_13935 [Thermoanaerobaculia bacterium]|nr:hypothetical protein [Thermoanaerobaculia bacterium]
MRKIVICLLALVLATPARALNTQDLLSAIAMPLAVAAVSNASGISDSRLADLVTALNQADVQPTQFVEVIRYVPVTLDRPDFVQFVQTETSQGVTGDALVNAIVDRLRSDYNLTPVLTLNGEPTTVVVSDTYVVAPTNVIATTNDPLAVIGLPLAVAAVSNITGVSQNELANLVATLNNADVPPTQVVEVLRYVPVALVADNGPQFVQFVQQQTTQGVTGPALVPMVVQRLQTFFPAQTQIVVARPPTPQTIVVQDFVPPVVVTRVEELRVHPHGGPPGQLKKELGLKTGAEVVHGERGERGRERRQVVPVVVQPPPMISSTPPPAPFPVAVPPDRAKENPQGEDRGRGNQGKDKGDHGKEGGKGKGHGKD